MIDNESVDALREQGKRMAGLISKDGPTEQVVSAEVVRVDDDGTVWVSVGGQEAPVDAGMAAKVGDKVSVRLANGTATLTDNKTRPATDDATALIAMGEAGAAHAVALDAQDVAEMAAEVARAIGQHFWTDEAGVHVSNEERDPEGSRNSIFNSLGLIFREGANYLMGLVSGSVVGGSSSDRGMAIFDGLGNAASNVVAWFGRNGIRIGKASAQHVEITANGIEITNGSTQGTVNGVDVAQTASDASDAKTASAQAKQIAEGAASTANTANQTANAASNTASAASTTANNAASAASEAQALVKASYGTSSTAASTQTKAVTCSGFSLFAGALVTVRFSTASTYSGLVKLNVNSTGAKDVWVANAATSASNLLLWGAGASITFRYDGTQYQVVGDPRSWYGKCSIAAGTSAKTDDAQAATGAVICKGATVSLGMAYSNTATSPTLNVAGTGAKALYAGNGTTRPTTANGFGWQDGSTVDLVFDGQYWRVGDTAALANAKAAQDDATSALTQANATKENFWADSSGVHVSTQSNTAAGTYNSLFTSAGLLFRNAANTLVSLTKSALNFYDGDGNNAANITASFGKDEVRVGKVGSGNKNVYVTSDGVDIRDDTTSLANFGSTVRVGKADKNYVSIKPTTTDFYIEDPLGTEFPKKVVSIGEGATDFGTSGIDATFLTADGIGVGTIGCTHLIMTGVKDKTAPAIYWHPTDGLQLGKGSYGALDTAWPTTFNEDASIWRTALGLGSAPYLPLSGGTMTGALKVSGGGNLRATMTGIDADSYPSSQLTAHSLTVFDKDGACIGQLRHIQGTDGTMGMALVARQTVNGSVKQNSLGAQVAPDGTRSYIVTDPGAFCEAINVGKTYSATKNMTISTAGIDTWTDGASVSLPAGTYMVVGEWIFQTGSSTGQRNNQVGIRAGSTTYNAQRVLYPNNAYARLQATAIVTLTATTTVKVSASSSMTYATAAATSIDAVRIR